MTISSPKLFFLFNLDFTYYGHALAVRWKREYGFGDDSFRGIVVGKQYLEFLRQQRDIAYDGLTLEQDLVWSARTEPPDIEFLAWAERELAEIDTLWRLYDAERAIPQFDRRQVLSMMSILLKHYFHEFTEHRPHAVIGFTISSMSALACYYVARHLGIPYVELHSTRVRNRAVIAGRPTQSEFPSIDARYRRIMAGEDANPAVLAAGSDFVRNFRERPLVPDGMARSVQIASKTTSLHPRRLIGLARISCWYYFGYYRKDPYVRSPARQAIDVLKMGLRRRRLLRGDVFGEPTPGEPYVYYALHQQPEMTTMILGPYWQDQLALVENIARSLPLGVRLYVKEHIPMLGMRPSSYYKRLRRMPNVKLIDPFASSLELVRNAKVVTAIAGTVGWEALVMGVPVITFGQVFYNAVTSVRKCRAIEDLPRLLRECIERPDRDDTPVNAYAAALLAESFDFDFERLSDPSRSYGSIRDSAEAATIYREYTRELERSGVFSISVRTG